MKIAIIGRGEILMECALALHRLGYEIPLVITAKEAPEYTVSAKDYELFSETVGATFIQAAKLDRDDIYEVLNRLTPMDIAISINFSGIISSKVMTYFQLGILNAHGGDLPRYRGNACQAWAILNGEQHIGLCIHRMVGGELDNGDILARKRYPISIDTRIGEVYEWFEADLPQMFVSVVEKLRMDPAYILETQSKDPNHALRCYPRRPEDGKIDWSKPASDVLRLINASGKPYAGAFCDYEGEKLIVWSAKLVLDNEIFCAIPGQVTMIGDGMVEVACGIHKLRVLSVEYRGQVSEPTLLIKSIRKRLR